jgi:hypothetical protein
MYKICLIWYQFFFYEIVIHIFIYLFILTVMDNVSVKLYNYMCDEVIGSEKVVNYRRQFFSASNP